MTKDSRSLVIVMYTLISTGVVMIYSASAVFAEQHFHQATYFLWRQLLAVSIGTFIFFVCYSLQPDFLKRHSRSFLGLAVLLLILVFVPVVGYSAGGARRWIRLPFLTFQPVEYAKFALCVYLADYLSRKRKTIVAGSLRVFVPPFILLLAMSALIVAQPDLGSCAFLLLISGILFFLSGIRLRYIVVVSLGAVAMLVGLIVIAPYRMSRIVAYLDPWKDPQGSGFQIIQSFLAFGLGGVKGVGLGQSTQKLFYLPQAHTDFIFSIISEELGLIGAVFVLALYALFFFLGNRVARRCQDPFSRLLSYSLVLLVTLQALMNLLVTTGLIPTKGLPLPFISYGGTALIFHMASVGLLVAIDRTATRYAW